MRDEIANVVYPILMHGLRLKQRMESGDDADIDTEQATLKGFLGTELEARRMTDFGGEGLDSSHSQGFRASSLDVNRRGGGDHWLGIRYALACWLDEIFILDSPWGTQWNERKLEEAMYGSNDRAWKFWEQARRAETRAGGDALEVFFLTVMLGFRGDLRYEPDKLQAWVAATQARIAKMQGQEWPVPPELDPTIFVPPLRARDQMQRMVLVSGVTLLCLIPLLAFSVMYHVAR